MSWTGIKAEIYSILDAITVVGGANYDWSTAKRLDEYIPDSDGLVATIHYPEGSPFETDVSEEFFTSSINRMLMRTIEIKIRVVSDALVVDTDELIDENNDAIDKALDDLTAALSSDTLGTCNLGVKGVNYVSASKEDIESKGVYYPYLLNVEYQIIYSKARG